ncbi:MAG: hypothetical protein HY670_02685 [Chloroflexi bacterium]|nr:hypothetical protein [Chloroflexota bacterium]
MNREQRRTEEKLRKRRLRWLEVERYRDEEIGKVVSTLEEDFDMNECENAKVFVADFLTDSGIFPEYRRDENVGEEDIAKFYGLEMADTIYVLDLLHKTLSKLEESAAEDEEAAD